MASTLRRVCSLSNLCRTMARDNFANEMRPKVAAVAATTASEIRRCDDAGGRDGCRRSCWSVIVWDLETVPDLRGFAAANSLVGKTDAEVRALLGNRFPKHIYLERTEKQLISAFCEKIAELATQLVTFNDNTFDLPSCAIVP